MENLKNRININVKLFRAHEDKKICKLTISPLYARSPVVSGSLAAIQMHKEKIKMVKPVYTGMCILDLSKTLMYDFYYNYLEMKYGDKCELLYTDTDSLLLEIRTEDMH